MPLEEEKLAALISRSLSGEASSSELELLHAYLKDHPREQYNYELLSGYWNTHHVILESPKQDSDEHFKHIMEQALGEEECMPKKLAHPHRLVRFGHLGVAAAVITVVVGAGYLIRDQKNITPGSTPVKQNEVVAKKGARSKMLLPDGSTVWLNSESKLRYSSNSFNGTNREVELSGEAFFDVVKDPRHPFIVHTSKIDILVLGTAFNVKSYPEASTIEATLIRGLIEVVKKGQPNAPRLYLHPLEKLVYTKEPDSVTAAPQTATVSHQGIKARADKEEKDIAISMVAKNLPDSVLPETSWIYHKLIFDGESFAEMAKRMERWFNIKLVLEDEKVANYRFRVVFENESIEQALHALQLTALFNYKIYPRNEVHIYRKR
ncbi:MAG: hypothetical protein NVSMB63_04350 [Sediminibacterium sp.]